MEYGCIGEHLGHSFSKEIHNALADYDYTLHELTPEELKEFMTEKSFKAINVTIPYKKDVIPYLDWISAEAKAINAVNTIVNKDGKLYGYNTDFYGLSALIEREGVSLKGKKVAILGSGGTSNTAYAVSQRMEASLVLRVSRGNKEGFVTYDDLYEKHSDIEVLINTTPCGMYPNICKAAVDIKKLPDLSAVFDAVYNPLSSQLIVDAKSQGITAVGGLYMLVSQAAYAVEKFTDAPVDECKVEDVYRNLYKDKMNIVLIGMPASGKTSVGMALADTLGKKFVDTDDLIIKSEKMTIPEIFSQKGEKAFREIEYREILEASKSNSSIVATGGGAVLNKKNIEALKGNGRVYFINRPLEMLVATSDRPLSSNKADLEKRYNERYSLYTEYADVVIDGTGTVEEVAKRIEADYYGYTCN